jgi:putative component of membrane protein insertase Oxa1/YidC/SpoIIIJ protein YidD
MIAHIMIPPTPAAVALGPSLFSHAIDAYQQFVSPYKGFRCAHRALHGGQSCSEFARRVAMIKGVAAVPAMLQRRFAECAAAVQVLDYDSREQLRWRKDDGRRRRKSIWDNCDPTPSSCDVSDCGGVDTLGVDAGCQCCGELGLESLLSG